MALPGDQGKKVRDFIVDNVLRVFQDNKAKWSTEAAIDNDRAETNAARKRSIKNFRAISLKADTHYATVKMGGFFKCVKYMSYACGTCIYGVMFVYGH